VAVVRLRPDVEGAERQIVKATQCTADACSELAALELRYCGKREHAVSFRSSWTSYTYINARRMP
jgi:hypothetical protein